MDLETWLWIALVVGCLALLLAAMIFLINPPEAWIKRYLRRNAKNDRIEGRPQ